MDLKTFRTIVDNSTPGIIRCETDLRVDFIRFSRQVMMSKLNEALTEIREQLIELNSGLKETGQSFFNCWFISVPQLLVLLDGVTDSASFKDELWRCRHFATGNFDFYSDFSYMQKLSAKPTL